MPKLSPAQILAFRVGKYKDFSTGTTTSFTPVPPSSLLNTPINLNGKPGITYNTLQTFFKGASTQNISDSTSFIIDATSSSLPDTVYHEYGYNTNIRHSIQYCGINIGEFAKRVKNGYCNLTIFGDSLLVPENNYLWSTFYSAWYPSKWRGVVVESVNSSTGNPRNTFIYTAGASSSQLDWGAASRTYPPGYPLLKPTATSPVTTAANNTYTESQAKFLATSGTTLQKFVTRVDGNTVAALNSAQTTTIAAVEFSSMSNLDGMKPLYMGHLQSIPNLHNENVGKYLHANNSFALDSFALGTQSQALECKILIPVGKKTDSFDKYHIAFYNGKGVTGYHAPWNNLYSNLSNAGTPAKNWFVLNYLYAGVYGNNAAWTTFDLQTAEDFSINIVNVGSLDKNNETGANLTTPLCWFVYLEGNNGSIDLSATPKLFITPRVRMHDKLATNGLQLSRIGYAGYSTSEFVGTSTPVTGAFGLTGLPLSSYGEIPVSTMAKYFEFDGTNTVMVHLGTNDAASTNLNVDTTVSNFKLLVSRIKEAWTIAKANNPECTKDGSLLINFLIPVTTENPVGNVVNNNTYYHNLFARLLPIVQADPSISIINFNEVLNKGFMNNPTTELKGTFYDNASGGFDSADSGGVDTDITGATKRYFAGDSFNVHPQGPSDTDWPQDNNNFTTLAARAGYRVMRGVWNIIEAAAGNTTKFVTTQSFSDINKVGGILVPCDAVAGYAQLTSVDKNYHRTGLMLYKKK